MGVETGGCPHTAIREDASINLAAIDEMNRLFPALDLTETIEVTALVAADKPGASDRLMLWIGNPVISTADEAAGGIGRMTPLASTRAISLPVRTNATGTRSTMATRS